MQLQFRTASSSRSRKRALSPRFIRPWLAESLRPPAFRPQEKKVALGTSLPLSYLSITPTACFASFSAFTNFLGSHEARGNCADSAQICGDHSVLAVIGDEERLHVLVSMDC